MLKKHSKFQFLILLLGLCPIATLAQREVATQNFANTTDGSPVSIQKYEDIKGSPYLTENWSDGQELVFVNPVSEFKIDLSKDGKKDERIFKKGFASDPETFYQVLADGKAVLLKRNKKVIVDKTPYNSATAVKLFESQDRYYLYVDNKLIPVKKNHKSILAALPDKTDELNKYIQEETIDFKTDEDITKLVVHYNSL
jgi:hypothetical protein